MPPRHRRGPDDQPLTLASGRAARELMPRALLFVLLLVTLVQVPREAYDVGHDSSSHATFEYYAAHGFQFGRDVYQNTGPLGYAHYAYTHVGLLPGRKLALQ